MRLSIGKCLLPNLLRNRKWTQTDLEERTGIHKNQISEYMNNKRTMSLKNARIIAQALHCHIDDLYDWKN